MKNSPHSSHCVALLLPTGAAYDLKQVLGAIGL